MLHTRLRVREWIGPNSDDWKESLVLCLLCGVDQKVERPLGSGLSTSANIVKIIISLTQFQPSTKIFFHVIAFPIKLEF